MLAISVVHDRTLCQRLQLTKRIVRRGQGTGQVFQSRKDAVEQLSDGELVRLLVAGDQEAMAVIFDRYYSLFFSQTKCIVTEDSTRLFGTNLAGVGNTRMKPVISNSLRATTKKKSASCAQRFVL